MGLSFGRKLGIYQYSKPLVRVKACLLISLMNCTEFRKSLHSHHGHA